MKPYRFPAFARVSPLLACVTALSPGFTHAADLYWDGSDAVKSWGQALNWSTTSTANSGSGVPTGSDIAIFGVTGLNTLQTILLNGDQSVLGISVVNNNASAAVGYKLVGGDGNHTLTIGASGIAQPPGGVAGPLTIGSADAGQAVSVILGASQTWDSRAAGQAIFVLNGVSAASGATTKLTLTGTNSGSKIEGGITDGGGTVSIAKSDSGTWTLSGSHNFSGGITMDGTGILTLAGANASAASTTVLNAGTLNIGNAAALGGGLFTISGGIINTSSGALTLTTNNTQSWNGNFTFTGTNNLNLGTGAVSLGAATGTERTITVGGSILTVGGVISNGTTANALIKAGAGSLTLSGANLHTGGTTLNAGTLNIGNASALGTGLFTINAGTINTSGGAIALSTNNAQSWNGNFTFTGTNSLNLGTGTVSLGTAAGTARTVTVTTNTLTVGGGISNGTTANALVKAGAGALTLSGDNLYTGGTTLSAGILNINSATALGTGNFTITTGTINNTSGADVALTTNNTQTWDGNFTFTGANSLNLGTGAVSLGTAAGTERTVTVSANTLTVGGAISNGTTATGLIKAGAGTLVLSGASTYTGPTTISNGILSVASLNSVTGGLASSNLGAPVTVETGTINLGSVATSAQLVYTGAGETTDRVINLAGTTGGGIITQNGGGLLKFTSNLTAVGAGTKSLTLQGTGDGEIAGIISNNSATNLTNLVKSGTGTWTLSGANNYTGATTVNAGSLRLAGAGLLSNGALTLNGGQLDLNGTNQTVGNLNGSTGSTITNNGAATTATLTVSNASGTYAGTLADGTGILAFTKAGTGTTTLTGANSHSGVTTVTGGILAISNAQALGSTSAGTTVGLGASLSLSGGITVSGETITINGLGSNSQGALRNGSGDNTWAGAVLLGSGSDVGSGNAARIGSQSGTLTVSGVIQNGATGNVAIRNADSGGLVVLSGNNTYTGTTHIVVGALSVSSINSVETNAGLGTVKSASSNLGAPTTVGNGTIHFATSAGAGELIYTGTGETTDRVINMAGTSATGGAILTQSGGGLLKFTSALTATGNGAKTLTLRGSTVGAGELAGAIINGAGTTSLAKSGTGTWTLSGTNTYTGGTSITGGTLVVSGGINFTTGLSVGGGLLRLGATDVISNTAPVTLSVGGGIETNNFSDQLGTLTVAGDATIDLSGTSFLRFADSSATVWSGLLGISNWSGEEGGGGTERLTFGSSASGLTTDQLSRIFFTNPDGFDPGTYAAAILSTGEVIPVIPEPSSALLAIAGACGFAFRRRRTA